MPSYNREKKKMIGHRTLLRENEDLPLWGAPAFMKKPPCCYVRALITLEQYMHSNDVQRSSEEQS